MYSGETAQLKEFVTASSCCCDDNTVNVEFRVVKIFAIFAVGTFSAKINFTRNLYCIHSLVLVSVSPLN